jgi:phage terminase large subunit-like protein
VLDLASKDDIAVEGMLFHKRLNDQDHYYWFGKFYLPERALEDGISPNASMYRKWHKQGFLQITEGAEIDFDVIKDSVLKSSSTFQIEEVLYDPWRATQLAHQLQAEGATIIEIRQTVQNLSLPMKEVLSAVQAGRLHHDGNPVMTWMMSNVTAKEDAKDNIYPRKEKRHMKIDGPVALIMAMARSMTVDSDDGVDGWLNRNGDGADQREEQAA